MRDSAQVDVNNKINNDFRVNKPAMKQAGLPIQTGKTPKKEC